jgi:tubulin polyglutamylase TTLL4
VPYYLLVVQEYIPNPYLIRGYKFDIRLYVVVSSFDPLKIYLYSDGLVRFCTKQYAVRC